MNGVDIEQVKMYNKTLESYRAKSAQLKAEIEVNSREINRLCAELSQELGVEVTPSNIRSIYEDQVKAINNNLAVGMDILNRIKEEERVAQEDAIAQVSNPMNNRAVGIGTGGISGAGMNMNPMSQSNIPQAPVQFNGATPGVFGAKSFNMNSMMQAARAEEQENDDTFGSIGSMPPIFHGDI